MNLFNLLATNVYKLSAGKKKLIRFIIKIDHFTLQVQFFCKDIFLNIEQYLKNTEVTLVIFQENLSTWKVQCSKNGKSKYLYLNTSNQEM